MPSPKLLAMLSIQPPIQGDETLLRLAQARLTEAGMGGEFYPGTADHMVELFAFRPPSLPCTAHLPRAINILEETGQATLVEYAERAAGELYGILLHDHKDFELNPDRTIQAFRRLDGRLAKIDRAPLLFVEFAAGLYPDFFASLFEKTAELRYVCAAIDVSHVGIHLCKAFWGENHPGEDVCALRPDSPDLPDKIDAVQAIVSDARTGVLALVERLGRLGKPLHFHLHDGHPLSTFSVFGVSDHLSFLQPIPLPFPYQGHQTLSGIFGVAGLRQLVQTAMRALPSEMLSFMLEVHPQAGRSALQAHEHIFGHWQDKRFAEHMNYWLDRLLDNATLVRDAFG